MFENENSVYKNMVNTNPFDDRRTDYNSYSPEQDEWTDSIQVENNDKNFWESKFKISRKAQKTLLIAGTAAVIFTTGIGTGISIEKANQEYKQDVADGVVYTETFRNEDGDYKFKMNDEDAWFVSPEGEKVENYEGLDADYVAENIRSNQGKTM